MHLLFAGRIQTFFLISDVMATISKEKWGPEQVQRGARLTEGGGGSNTNWAMPKYTGHFLTGGFF